MHTRIINYLNLDVTILSTCLSLLCQQPRPYGQSEDIPTFVRVCVCCLLVMRVSRVDQLI